MEERNKRIRKIYSSNKAEMVAVYGRRRVGKTYLVDEVFQGRVTFRHAGLSPLETKPQGLLEAQLNHFYNSLTLHGMEDEKEPKNWLDAFFLLEKLLQNLDTVSETKRLFLREISVVHRPAT